jgi:hypothetical protein
VKNYTVEEFAKLIIEGEEALFLKGNIRKYDRFKSRNFKILTKVLMGDCKEKTYQFLDLIYHENRYVRAAMAAYYLSYEIFVDEAEPILESFAKSEPDGTTFAFVCECLLIKYRKIKASKTS